MILQKNKWLIYECLLKIGVAAAAVPVMLVCSVALLQGSGVLADMNLTHSGSEANWVKVLALFVFLMGSITYQRFFLWLILPVICVMAIYYPIGANFGLPNAGQVVSALNTDALEALEFFRMIPLWQYFVPLALRGCFSVCIGY